MKNIFIACDTSSNQKVKKLSKIQRSNLKITKSVINLG